MRSQSDAIWGLLSEIVASRNIQILYTIAFGRKKKKKEGKTNFRSENRIEVCHQEVSNQRISASEPPNQVSETS